MYDYRYMYHYCETIKSDHALTCCLIITFRSLVTGAEISSKTQAEQSCDMLWLDQWRAVPGTGALQWRRQHT